MPAGTGLCVSRWYPRPKRSPDNDVLPLTSGRGWADSRWCRRGILFKKERRCGGGWSRILQVGLAVRCAKLIATEKCGLTECEIQWWRADYDHLEISNAYINYIHYDAYRRWARWCIQVPKLNNKSVHIYRSIHLLQSFRYASVVSIHDSEIPKFRSRVSINQTYPILYLGLHPLQPEWPEPAASPVYFGDPPPFNSHAQRRSIFSPTRPR